MNIETLDRALTRIPPPLILVIMVLLGWTVDRYIYSPKVFPAGSEDLIKAAGGVLLLFGIVFNLVCLWYFRQSEQSPLPHKTTTSIIDSGPYALSRNPIYLGAVLIQTGIGLIFLNLWILLFVPFSLVLYQFLVVLPEEIYLEEKFGDNYTQYKSRVRRWI